jgi:hypothetical protein
MILLMLLLGIITAAAGMFGLGLGLPVRETTFGAAALVSASVAITGGFILVGLAAAVSELRRAIRQAGGAQPARPVTEPAERRMEPRLVVPSALGPEEDRVIAARFDASEPRERGPRREERLSDSAEIAPEPPADFRSSPVLQPSDRGIYPHSASIATLREAPVRPSDHRHSEKEPPEPRTEPTVIGGDLKSPPLSPAESAEPPRLKSVRILKSGMINDLAYRFFSDGSIETQTADGILRFASIDDFRRHIELKNAG